MNELALYRNYFPFHHEITVSWKLISTNEPIGLYSFESRLSFNVIELWTPLSSKEYPVRVEKRDQTRALLAILYNMEWQFAAI